MEVKATLDKPYSEQQRIEFIIEQNRRNGYEIRETSEQLQAWGYTAEEQYETLSRELQEENTRKAKQAVEEGYVEFKGAQFETNAQTVGDLTATMLLMQSAGLETYDWLSKDDQVVTLTLEDFGTLGGLIAGFKAHIWSEEYLEYKRQIAEAETYEELKEIVIEY